MTKKNRDALLDLVLDFPASEEETGRYVQGGPGTFVLVSDLKPDYYVAVDVADFYTATATTPQGRPMMEFQEAIIPAGDLHPDMILFRAPCGAFFTATCVQKHLKARTFENFTKDEKPVPYEFDCTGLDVLEAVMAEYGWR